MPGHEHRRDDLVRAVQRGVGGRQGDEEDLPGRLSGHVQLARAVKIVFGDVKSDQTISGTREDEKANYSNAGRDS